MSLRGYNDMNDDAKNILNYEDYKLFTQCLRG